MFAHLTWLASNLKWAWNILIHRSLFSHRLHDGDDHDQVKLTEPAADEVVECAVCLCKFEEDEEIKELRCGHLFHRVCVERWININYNYGTCPLCRDSIFAPPRFITELGEEVILFKFSHFINSRERHTWWLR